MSFPVTKEAELCRHFHKTGAVRGSAMKNTKLSFVLGVTLGAILLILFKHLNLISKTDLDRLLEGLDLLSRRTTAFQRSLY
jgi:hypothetical protein